MAIKQLSVFVENKKGTILDVTKSIAEAGVDIRALSVADTQDFGILRLIVSDIEKAKDALSEAFAYMPSTDLSASTISFSFAEISLTVSEKSSEVISTRTSIESLLLALSTII